MDDNDDNNNGDDSVLTMMNQIMTFIMIIAVNLSYKLLIFLILIIKIIIAFYAVLFYFYFINFTRFLGGIPQHHVANYCGPVRARPQHWELRALVFTNSVWVL